MINRFLTKLRPVVERFPRLSAIYRNFRDEAAAWAKPQATPWGFSLAGNESMARGTFEARETEIIRGFLAEIDVFVNVGANIGYYCCHALSMEKEVIAVEPIQRNLRFLYQNIKNNGWSDIEIYPLALSNSIGVLEIFGGNTGASILKGWAGISENYVTLVPTSTLDRVFRDRFRGKKVLILIDIEGAEKRMLKEANLLLDNHPKPIWIMEIAIGRLRPGGTEFDSDPKSIFEIFFQHGYEAFEIGEVMQPVTVAQLGLFSGGDREFISHNFLFVERGSLDVF